MPKLTLAREIANVRHDLDIQHRRSKLDLAYCAKLESRLDELRDQEADEIGRATCAAAADQEGRA